jgi:O-antigen/teichoic acid export membrane protein
VSSTRAVGEDAEKSVGQPDTDDHTRTEGGGHAPVEGFSELPRDELRRRAFAGVFVAFSGGLFNLVLAFGGNLVLARLLTPHDFGVVAVGSTVILIASAFAEGGFGAGLIRRPEPPLASELRTLAGIQLAVLTFAAAVVALLAAPLGTIGEVTALMVIAMPIAGLQGPGRVALARSLHLRSIVLVDSVGLATFYVWAISMVAFFDLGVWGLASAGIARAVAGTLAMAVVPAGALYRPTLERLRQFREIIAFGIRFQAGWIVAVLRDQGLNGTTALVSGVTTLGLWSLGQRLMQVPLLLQEAIGRVAFPTVAHVLASGEEAKPLVERTARLSGACFALLLSTFVAVAPAFIPLLFGEKWSDVAVVIPGACLALLVSGTAVNPAVNYLWAAGRPDIVLRAAILYATAVIVLTAALLPTLDLVAIGVSLAIGAFAESLLIARALRGLLHANLLPELPAPVVAATSGATVGWVLASSDLPPAIAGLLAGLVAAAICAAVLAVLSRAALVDLTRVAANSLRHSFGGEKETPVGT